MAKLAEREGKRLDELSRLKGGTPASTKELLPSQRGESLIGKKSVKEKTTQIRKRIGVRKNETKRIS